MNIYETCPMVENERFLLRPVEEADCADLLKIYSDPAAVPLFNSDNCNGDDFYYTSYERMLEAIRFWHWSYDNGWFVRWSIVEKAADSTVGTVELCGSQRGILRLDLRSDYENEAEIFEILSLVVEPAFLWLGCDRLITKARPIAADRIRVLTDMGFVPEQEPVVGHDGTCYGDYYGKVNCKNR